MQDCSVFRGVDVLAREHRVTLGEDALLTRQVEKGRHHITGDALLAEVGTKSSSLQGPCGSPIRLIGEEIPEIPALQSDGQIAEPCPCRGEGRVVRLRGVHVGSLALRWRGRTRYGALVTPRRSRTPEGRMRP